MRLVRSYGDVQSQHRFASRDSTNFQGHFAHRGLEDTLIAPIHLRRPPHLVLVRIGVHDPVLPRDLLAVPLPERLFLLQIALQFLLEVAVERLPLALLERAGALVGWGALNVLLEAADLVADARVLELGRRHQLVQPLLREVVGAGKGLLVQGPDALHIGGQATDLIAHVRHTRQEVLLRERGHRGGCGAVRVGALWLRSRILLHLMLFLR